MALIAAHWNSVRTGFASSPRRILAAAFAGMALLPLVTAWLGLTFYEAWLSAAKWMRFPFLLVALLPYHLAEEMLLCSARPGKKWRRLAPALSLRPVIWGG